MWEVRGKWCIIIQSNRPSWNEQVDTVLSNSPKLLQCMFSSLLGFAYKTDIFFDYYENMVGFNPTTVWFICDVFQHR